ncbi:unnamed protein product [Arctia plantaginis]|uniref:Uncharacterized protein n=1 Tax=Arctia plantaginis TaxID=874455 RepID=A0A8S0ZGT0_ARCPL|nr:unnamed protein product [Arctia plantaginis]
MKYTVVVILVVFTTQVTSKVPNLYKPSEKQLRIVFPDEYDVIKLTKPRTEKIKDTPTSCKNKTCSLEEIYDIFGIDPTPIEITLKLKKSDDRIALAGDECAAGSVKVKGICIEED